MIEVQNRLKTESDNHSVEHHDVSFTLANGEQLVVLPLQPSIEEIPDNVIELFPDRIKSFPHIPTRKLKGQLRQRFGSKKIAIALLKAGVEEKKDVSKTNILFALQSKYFRRVGRILVMDSANHARGRYINK